MRNYRGNRFKIIIFLGILSIVCTGFDTSKSIEKALATNNPDEIIKTARELTKKLFAVDDENTGQKDKSLGDISDIIGLYRKAETIEPSILKHSDENYIGFMYLMLSPSYAPDAKRYLERSFSDPDHITVDALIALGNAYLYMNHYTEARTQYLIALEKRPADPVILLNLGIAERNTSNMDSARLRLKTARELSKPGSVIHRSITIALAELEVSLEKMQPALALLDPLIKSGYKDVTVYNLLKSIYEHEGNSKLLLDIEKKLRNIQNNGQIK